MNLNAKSFAAVLCLVTVAIVLVGSLEAQTRNTVPSAQNLIDRALKTARTENKTVFIHFGASWCKWCKELDAALDSPELRDLITQHFVLVHLTVQESDDKKSLENPGAEKLMNESGGGKTGVPYYLFLDKDGIKVANSMAMPDGGNIGYPATPEEIKTFGDLMPRAAPRMTVADRARIVDYLTTHAPK